jgi:hypothetical protein
MPSSKIGYGDEVILILGLRTFQLAFIGSSQRRG